MKARSLKRQFIIYFSLVVGLSFILTAAVWATILWLMVQGQADWIRPANYYEKKVPPIWQVVKAEGDRLLQEGGGAPLEQVIDSNGMSYAIVDQYGSPVYGTLEGLQLDGGHELIAQLNSTQMIDSSHARSVMPIVNTAGELKGAVILSYVLAVTAGDEPKNPFTSLLVTLITLLPFLLVILFTWLFGRRFSRQLSQPIQALIEGTKRVQRRDLDFSFSYEGTTEIAQLVKAFDEMRRELSLSLQREWRLEQERRDMVAALAHDLRTPLAIVQGHVEGLLEGGADRPERLQRYLETIDKNTKRAARLVQEMNMVSEMETPEFRLNRRAVNIRAFMEDKASDIERLCGERDIQFVYSLEDKREERTSVLFDPDRLSQMLDNLFANSVRFTPAGGTISWKTELTEYSLMMKITDTGPGFPEHALDTVFDKFVQGDTSRSRHKGHAGLGLYMAKLLTGKHGGVIQASNLDEGGACVTLTLPGQQRERRNP